MRSDTSFKYKLQNPTNYIVVFFSRKTVQFLFLMQVEVEKNIDLKREFKQTQFRVGIIIGLYWK